MGQTYSVYLQLRIKDADGLKKALTDKIARGEEERTNYSLEHYQSIGVDTNTLEGLLQVFFGGWNAGLNEYSLGDFTSDFDASYGWESVMMETFDAMAPFLEDGSCLKIYPDTSYDLQVVENGKAIVKH